MKSVLMAVFVYGMLCPLFTYAFSTALMDAHGKKYDVNVEMMFTQMDGKPLPDGMYKSKKGKNIMIKDGHVVPQGMGHEKKMQNMM